MSDDRRPLIFRLGNLTLDLDSGRLHGPAGDITLRPKTFALLSVLARNAGKVMSKDALLAEVWPDIIVSEDSLTQCAHELRRMLGPEAGDLVRTVPKRGYLLLAPARAAPPDTTPERQVAPDGVAVLPFRLGYVPSDRERLLIDAVAHDLTGDLARTRLFRVTGRGSAFALRDLADNPARLRALLGVSFLVTGTVTQGRCCPILRLDLVETLNGALLWTQDVPLDLTAIHLCAPELAENCVHAIAQTITLVERHRVARMAGQHPLSAWEAFHGGLEAAFGPHPPGRMSNSHRLDPPLSFFERAVELDPGFARAHAYRSFCHYNITHSLTGADRALGIRATLDAGSDAIRADETNPVSHWAFGRALFLSGDPKAATRHVAEAIRLCPSFPHAHYSMGNLEAVTGDPQRAMEFLDRSETLSPFDPLMAAIQINRAMACLRLQDADAAALWAERASLHHDGYDLMQLTAALVLSAVGQDVSAQRALQGCPDLRAETDKFLQSFPGMDAELRRILDEGLRRLSR